MREYSIMTLNLRNDPLQAFKAASFARRAEAVTAMIQECHPDLIGVQELSRSMFPYLQEIFKEYGIFGDSRHSLLQDEYSSILYKKDRFELIGGDTKWLSHRPDLKGSKILHSLYPRIVTFAYFKDNETQDFFTFANTHLDAGLKTVRDEQAQILAKILMERQKGTYLFVTGDFNATHASDALHLFQKVHLSDAVKDEVGGTLRGAFAAHRYHQQPIDHIYISRGLSVLNVRKIHQKYHGVHPSDHYPLIAYIAL